MDTLINSVVITPGMTFREYFFSGLTTDPFWVVVAACVAGIVGMISHWLKRVVKDKEEEATFLEWFVLSKFKSTVIAMGSMVVALVASIMPLEIAQLSLYSAIIMGFTTGYAADSAFNSAESK
jgi:hypothetical protein